MNARLRADRMFRLFNHLIARVAYIRVLIFLLAHQVPHLNMLKMKGDITSNI